MIGTQLFAASVYLLPIAVWSLLRIGRAGADEGRFAVEIPVIVAADLVSVVLLTRVFTLETATLISRVIWAAGGGIGGWRWWRAGGRPRRLTEQQLRRLGELALVALGAVLVSVQLSRTCAIWDREWHIPLVSALRGQRLPFVNVFLPPAVLAYHFSGDVQAAMFQTLSGGRLHSSLALSLAHDVMFALLALNVVCFLRGTIIRQTLLAALVVIAVVMTGPVTLLRDSVYKLGSGFGLVNLLTLSFRPHVPLACLMGLGFLQIVVRALMEEQSPRTPEPSQRHANEPSDRHRWRSRLGQLALLVAGLSITDETSLGILGMGLGAVWLVDPRVVAPSRRAGGLALLGILITIVVTMLVLGGSIGRDAPHYALSLVSPRAPGYASPPVSLWLFEGQILLLQDLLPVFGAVAALIAIAIVVRDRVTVGIAVLHSAMALVAIAGFTCFDFEGRSSEVHRFLTVILVSAPLLAAIAIGWRARVTGAAGTAAGLAAIVFYLSAALGVASTLEWISSGVAFRQCPNPAIFGWAGERFYDVDCRRETDATLGEKTVATYVDGTAFDLWAGCHPVFLPAPPLIPGGQKIKISGPWIGAPALEQMARTLSAPTDRANVVCLTAVPTRDPTCARALALGHCQPRRAFAECSADRRALAVLARPVIVPVVRPQPAPAPRK